MNDELKIEIQALSESLDRMNGNPDAAHMASQRWYKLQNLEEFRNFLSGLEEFDPAKIESVIDDVNSAWHEIEDSADTLQDAGYAIATALEDLSE